MMNEKLGEVSTLARALIEADAAVEAATNVLKEMSERARRIREEDLPGAMLEIGLRKVVLEDGSAVEIKGEVYASIPVEKRDAAYTWLEESGFGALIKTEVAVGFGKGQLTEAQELAGRLQGDGFEGVTLERSVHSSTLKAFLKEQLAAAADIPLELFGARAVDTAKVTLPKVKKTKIA